MNAKGQLSRDECQQLLSTTLTSGYSVLQDIFQRELTNIEIDLQNTDPADAKRVIAMHRVAVGARKFYEAVMSSVEFACREASAPKKTAIDRAEAELAQLVNGLAEAEIDPAAEYGF
jgi:hypothetical protein